MAVTHVEMALNRPSVAAESGRGKRFYAPELDVLRFGAFMLVFCRHIVTSLGDARHVAADESAKPLAAQAGTVAVTSRWVVLQEVLQSLDFGVCLFFFLSSFLITRLLLMERKATGMVAVRNFYVRRILRIWPLYFVFLLAVVVLSHWLPMLRVSPSRLLVAVLFVSNWAAVFHGWQSIAIQPLWSVSVEEQFYAVWPWIARYGRKAIIGGSLMLIAGFAVTLLVLSQVPDLEVTATLPNTMVQALFLAGGALTACYAHPENRRWSDSTRVLMIFGGFAAWIIASAGFHVVRTISPGVGSLLLGYLFVLLGVALIFNGVAGWNRRELPAWLIQLGRMSYGLYVFHVAVLLALYNVAPGVQQMWHVAPSPYATVAAVSMLGFALTVGLAFLSYRFLELPFLRLKDRFAVIASRPV